MNVTIEDGILKTDDFDAVPVVVTGMDSLTVDQKIDVINERIQIAYERALKYAGINPPSRSA